VALLESQDADRVDWLVPIRRGRMMASPFSFLRGAAGIMASDLAATPVSDLNVQACGDAHLANFGLYASPERQLVFELTLLVGSSSSSRAAERKRGPRGTPFPFR